MNAKDRVSVVFKPLLSGGKYVRPPKLREKAGIQTRKGGRAEGELQLAFTPVLQFLAGEMVGS